MVTEETEISELLDLVASIGDKIQEDSKMLDSMAEIVKKVIMGVPVMVFLWV